MNNLIVRIVIVVGVCMLAVKAVSIKNISGGDWVGGLDYVLNFATIAAVDADERPLAERKRERYIAVRKKQGFLNVGNGAHKLRSP